MRKNISTQDLKTHVGEVVDAVRLRGDRYIIERRGKPVAAIVPLSVNESDERQRGRFFELLDAVRGRNPDVSAEQIEKAVDRAVAGHRGCKGPQRRRA
jgi:prevent-host-death family protein